MIKRLSLLFLGCCLALPLFSSEKTEQIVIRNKQGGTHKFPSKNPIVPPVEAFIDDTTNVLSLIFTSDLGIVNVIVSDSNGNIVFSDVVNASDNTSTTLILDSNMSGDYTLSIQFDDQELNGDFFIN